MYNIIYILYIYIKYKEQLFIGYCLCERVWSVSISHIFKTRKLPFFFLCFERIRWKACLHLVAFWNFYSFFFSFGLAFQKKEFRISREVRLLSLNIHIHMTCFQRGYWYMYIIYVYMIKYYCVNQTMYWYIQWTWYEELT